MIRERTPLPDLIRQIETSFDLTGVRLFADKSDVFGNLLFLGERNGTTLLVKFSETFPDMIEQEGRMLARVGEILPNHVPALDRTVSGHGCAAFSMSFLANVRSLADLLAEGPFPEEGLDAFVAQLDAITARLAAAGICHRDFEPQNILLDAKGHVTVIDWQGAVQRGQTRDPYADWMATSRNRLCETGRDGLGLLAWNDRRHFLIDVKDERLRKRLRPLWRVCPDAGTYRAPVPTGLRLRLCAMRWWYGIRLLLPSAPEKRRKLLRRCACLRPNARTRRQGRPT